MSLKLAIRRTQAILFMAAMSLAVPSAMSKAALHPMDWEAYRRFPEGMSLERAWGAVRGPRAGHSNYTGACRVVARHGDPREIEEVLRRFCAMMTRELESGDPDRMAIGQYRYRLLPILDEIVVSGRQDIDDVVLADSGMAVCRSSHPSPIPQFDSRTVSGLVVCRADTSAYQDLLVEIAQRGGGTRPIDLLAIGKALSADRLRGILAEFDGPEDGLSNAWRLIHLAAGHGGRLGVEYLERVEESLDALEPDEAVHFWRLRLDCDPAMKLAGTERTDAALLEFGSASTLLGRAVAHDWAIAEARLAGITLADMEPLLERAEAELAAIPASDERTRERASWRLQSLRDAVLGSCAR